MTQLNVVLDGGQHTGSAGTYKERVNLTLRQIELGLSLIQRGLGPGQLCGVGLFPEHGPALLADRQHVFLSFHARLGELISQQRDQFIIILLLIHLCSQARHAQVCLHLGLIGLDFQELVLKTRLLSRQLGLGRVEL